VYVPTTADRRRTLADLIDRFVSDYLPIKPNSKDAEGTKAQLDWWKTHYGHVTLDKLLPDVIAEARGQLALRKSRLGKPLSGATINRYLAALSAVCKWAWKELRWLPSNPVLSVTKAQESEGIVRFLSDEERRALLAACKASANPNIYLAVILALATGVRYDNLRSLRWEDVDWDRWTLQLDETKNGTARHVPLVGAAQRVLKEHLDRDPTGEGWVFKGAHDFTPADLNSPWRAVRSAAGLTDFRFHDLRHTTASYLTQGGAGLAQVADALGHKTLAMARRYSHQSGEHVRATLATIAGKLED